MKKRYPLLMISIATVLLAGCDFALINPAGYIAKQQSNMMMFSLFLMLLVVVPVICLTLFFCFKYRDRKGNSTEPSGNYDPSFYHSNKLEIFIWGIPITLITVLGLVTWGSTFLLDPYRPLARIDSQTKIKGIEENLGPVKKFTNMFIDPSREDAKTVDSAKPLVVEVAALDWKWLFIYPELGIATVNELAAPVNRPIEFRITSSSHMNSFFVPHLAGQIYAMPGMQTKLHAVINREGVFKGFSGNYTGHGFSQMYFYFHSFNNEGFDQWVEKVRSSPKSLNQSEYLALDQYDQKNERGHVIYFGKRYYANVQPDLYDRILNLCATPGMMCADEMMSIDLAGGESNPELSRQNFRRLQYDYRRDTSTQLKLAEYTDVLPSVLVCTTDTSDLDYSRQVSLKTEVSPPLVPAI